MLPSTQLPDCHAGTPLCKCKMMHSRLSSKIFLLLIVLTAKSVRLHFLNNMPEVKQSTKSQLSTITLHTAASCFSFEPVSRANSVFPRLLADDVQIKFGACYLKTVL